MRIWCLLLLLLLPAWAEEAKLEAAGRSWTWHYAQPAGPGPWPVVLILHGAGGSGPFYLEQCGWAEEARRQGFLAVAPEGLPLRPGEPPQWKTNPRVWNTGQLQASPERTGIDDLAFLTALLDELPKRFPIDPKRVYCTGHSNGAGMTFRLAAACSDRLAAIAPVASPCGLMAPTLDRAIPTLFVLGTDDPVIPWQGGIARTPWGERPLAPISASLGRWARALGCGGPVQDSLAGGVLTRSYGSLFQALFVAGQGHNWPGALSGMPVEIAGPNGPTWKATPVIWRFFSEHV